MKDKIAKNTSVIGYARCSTWDQDLGLEVQRERIESYCRMRGLNLVALLAENGTSGSVPLSERAQGKVLARMLAENKGSAVVALKLDRLFRDAGDALTQTKAWTKSGITLHLIDLGGQTLDTSGSMGRMMLTMLAGFAEWERSVIAERTKAALQRKKATGRVYGRTPFGFTREGDKLVANKAEQNLIRKARQLRDAGESLRFIANMLNSATGRTSFYASGVDYILKNDLFMNI